MRGRNPGLCGVSLFLADSENGENASFPPGSSHLEDVF